MTNDTNRKFQLLFMLKEKSLQTSEDLANRLNLKRNSVSEHLCSLYRDKKVDFDFKNSHSKGRPRKLWKLHNEFDLEIVEKNYDVIKFRMVNQCKHENTIKSQRGIICNDCGLNIGKIYWLLRDF